MKPLKEIQLDSGKTCELLEIKKESIPNYFLIAFPKTQGQPDHKEVGEMLTVGIAHAKEISFKLLGDEEAYTIFYSGYSARREKGWHLHIVILGSRWKKARLYFVLALKNLLQALKLRRDDAPKI